MSRGRRVAAIGGGVAAVAAAIVFGVVGIEQTVSAGGQARICGLTVGVTTSDQTVRLAGTSGGPYGPGDRVRVAALCVVEIVSIEETPAGPDDDGGSARVHLRWRLW